MFKFIVICIALMVFAYWLGLNDYKILLHDEMEKQEMVDDMLFAENEKQCITCNCVALNPNGKPFCAMVLLYEMDKQNRNIGFDIPNVPVGCLIKK